MNSPNSFEVHNGPTEMKLAAMRCLSEKLLEAASAAPPCVNITLPILHSGLKMEKKYNKKCEYDDGCLSQWELINQCILEFFIVALNWKNVPKNINNNSSFVWLP